MSRFLSLSAGIAAALLPFACTAQNPPTGTPATSETAAPTATPAPAGTASTSGEGKITYSSCHVEGPYVAMTFDDGPSAANTPRLLDMLKERKIHATFFMCGENAIQYPQIIKRMVSEGHEVANHSWNHPQLTKLSDADVKSQLQRTHDAIIAGGGVAPKLMRPPYGAFSQRQQRWCYGEMGYKCILWDVDPLDWKVRNAAHVESEILKQTVHGSIILSHDIHKTTVDAMPATLDALLAKGLKFVTVSELLAMDKPVPPKPKTTPVPKTTGAAAKEGSTAAAPGNAPAQMAAPAATPAARPAR